MFYSRWEFRESIGQKMGDTSVDICDNRICNTCEYFIQLIYTNDYGLCFPEDKCRRLQIKHCNYVTGNKYYTGKILDCNNEREISLTWKERFLGKNKDKCGKSGKYWISKEKKS